MTQTKKTYLPITLDITNKTILLVGNGKSAWKKMRILQRFTQQIVVLAISVSCGRHASDYKICPSL